MFVLDRLIDGVPEGPRPGRAALEAEFDLLLCGIHPAEHAADQGDVAGVRAHLQEFLFPLPDLVEQDQIDFGAGAADPPDQHREVLDQGVQVRPARLRGVEGRSGVAVDAERAVQDRGRGAAADQREKDVNLPLQGEQEARRHRGHARQRRIEGRVQPFTDAHHFGQEALGLAVYLPVRVVHHLAVNRLDPQDLLRSEFDVDVDLLIVHPQKLSGKHDRVAVGVADLDGVADEVGEQGPHGLERLPGLLDHELQGIEKGQAVAAARHVLQKLPQHLENLLAERGEVPDAFLEQRFLEVAPAVEAGAEKLQDGIHLLGRQAEIRAQGGGVAGQVNGFLAGGRPKFALAGGAVLGRVDGLGELVFHRADDPLLVSLPELDFLAVDDDVVQQVGRQLVHSGLNALQHGFHQLGRRRAGLHGIHQPGHHRQALAEAVCVQVAVVLGKKTAHGADRRCGCRFVGLLDELRHAGFEGGIAHHDRVACRQRSCAGLGGSAGASSSAGFRGTAAAIGRGGNRGRGAGGCRAEASSAGAAGVGRRGRGGIVCVAPVAVDFDRGSLEFLAQAFDREERLVDVGGLAAQCVAFRPLHERRNLADHLLQRFRGQVINGGEQGQVRSGRLRSS